MQIIKPMGIESPSRFLVDMNSSMDYYQALRETVQNAIQAKPLDGSPHQVLVTYNRAEFDRSGVKKLCIVDTGRGMDSASMERNFSMLCASGGTDWSGDEKKGLGIKGILPSNQAGIMCESFQGGVGNRLVIGMNPDTREAGVQGLYDEESEEYRALIHLEDAGLLQQYFPKATHGTIVTLWGNSEEEHTYMDDTIREVAKYLNLRFYTLPEGVELRADEVFIDKKTGKEKTGSRRIFGLEHFLLKDALGNATIKLDDGGHAYLVHINKQSYSAHHDTCRNLTTGFKHDTEFYPLTPYAAEVDEKDRARKIVPYRQCGFNYGEAPSEIAIIIEPPQARIEGFKRTYGAYPTQARNTLLFSDGKDAPNLVPDWAKYGAEIQAKMPKYFLDLKRKREEELSLKLDADDEELRRQSAQETLKDAEMFTVKKGGGLKVVADLRGGFPGGNKRKSVTGVTTPPPDEKKHGGGTGGTGFSTGAIGEAAAIKKPLTVKLMQFIPTVVVSTDQEWAASIHNMVAQLEERANTLKINSEFLPLLGLQEQLVTEWEGRAPPDFVKQIVASERNICLSDAIVRARVLRRDPVMSACVNAETGLLSPSALTMPFLGNSNVKAFAQRVNRRVAARYGSKRDQRAA